MIHEILPVGWLACNCSIYGDPATREAIVIDPGDQVEDILGILGRHRLKVKAIVLTHGHLDHVGGAAELRRRSGAPVLMHAGDRDLLVHLEEQAAWLGLPPPERPPVDEWLEEGSTLALGPVKLTVIHTPGHTQGSISLWVPEEKKLFSGDTLFRESIGRTDLPGGNYQQLISSLREKLLGLPADVEVLPGHGPATTIGHERRYNPFLSGW